jgi:hypothetical protein
MHAVTEQILEISVLGGSVAGLLVARKTSFLPQSGVSISFFGVTSNSLI